MTPRNKPDVLYLHVPFCRTICSYCDFCHTVYKHEDGDAWLDALKKELALREINRSLRTVYIGGGTPSVLEEAQLERLLSMLDPYTGSVREYTIEINPETLSAAKAEILASHGIRRASIGFQTSDEKMLKKMNRRHTMADMERCVKELRDAGIDNLSFDLMYSLPDQTLADLQQSVNDALKLQPKHLSLYSLTIEENTVFAKTGAEPCDEDTEADMYRWICDTLPAYGFRQYEISNFALPGYESMHNTAYWEYEDFYGISCGASGKEKNIRYDNTRSLRSYLTDPLQREEILLSERDRMFETVMMGLRLKRGFSLSRFAETFGVPLTDAYGDKIREMIRQEMLETDGDRIRCTEKGFPVLNEILVCLMDDEGE